MRWKKIKTSWLNPIPFYTWAARWMVHVLYRVTFKGFHHLPKTGGAMLISNHVSYMDGVVINAAVQGSVKRPVRYVIDEKIYRTQPIHYFMKLNNAIPIAPNRASVEQAIATISDALKNDELVCIFPEGMLTHTGNMTRFRFGIEWIIDHTPAPIYPIALKGLWGSIFSRKYKRSRFKFVPRKFRMKVTAVCGQAIPPERAKVSHLQRVIMDLKNGI